MVAWAHLSLYPKRHFDRFSHFAQLTAECPYTLQWAATSPSPKIAPFQRDLHHELVYALSNGAISTDIE